MIHTKLNILRSSHLPEPIPHRPSSRRSAWLVLLILTFIVSAIAWISASDRARDTDQAVRKHLLQLAMEVAGSISPSSVRALAFDASDLNRAEFVAMRTTMEQLAAALPNRGIYTLAMREGTFVFGPESYAPDDPMASPPGTPFLQPSAEDFEVFQKRRPKIMGPNTDEYGTFISALAPVQDPLTGEVLMAVGIDLPLDKWEQLLRHARLPPLLIAIALTLLLFAEAGLYARMIRRDPAHPRLLALLVTLYGLALTMSLFAWVRDLERQDRQIQFNDMAEHYASYVKADLRRMETDITLLASLFHASHHVDAEEFNTFTSLLFPAHNFLLRDWISIYNQLQSPMPAIQSWQWIGDTSPSFPVRYATSDHDRADWLGFDHAAHPALVDMIHKALRHPGETTSACLLWPDPTMDSSMCFLYQATASETQTGLVCAVVRLDHIAQGVTPNSPQEDPLITASLAPLVDPPSLDLLPGLLPCTQTVEMQRMLVIIEWDRIFFFCARPSQAFFESSPARASRLAGLAGLMLTLAIASLIIALQHRQTRLEEQVSARTREARAGEKKYRQLFEAMTSGFALHEIILDAQGVPRDYRFLEVNPAFERQTGIDTTGVIGRTLLELLPNSEPIWVERYGKVALTGIPCSFEHYAESTQRYYHVIAYRTEPLQFAVLFNDITERKKSEAMLAHRSALQRLLMQMATRFINIPPEHLEEATQEGLAEVGQFVGADRAYQFRYDFDKEIMTNTHEWCREGVPSEIGKIDVMPLNKAPHLVEAHRRGEPFFVPDVAELPPDALGQSIFKERSIRSFFTTPMMMDGGCIGFIGFDSISKSRVWGEDERGLLQVLATLLVNANLRARSETNRLTLERQLLESQKLESLGVLAGGVAHDFNNILTSILGNADLLLQDLEPASPIRDSLQAISTGARSAADLCRQMLAYAGKGSMVLESFSINTLIEEVLHLIKASISKGAALDLHLDPLLPPVHGDASKIRQIILNLVINASDALEGENGVISLRTGTQQCDETDLRNTVFDFEPAPGRYVTLEVTDTGQGMSPDTVKRIFEPFFTTKFTGRGLGLAAVMGIIRSHNGALIVDSELHKGTSFKVLLPVSATPDSESLPHITTTDPVWKGNGLVLMVDDEPSIRTLGQRMLERLGFSVLLAEDGVEAVAMYREHKADIHVVILDLTMPRMNGEDTLLELKRINPDVRVILASGYSRATLSQSLGAANIAAFIQKPFTSATLSATLKTVLEEAS